MPTKLELGLDTESARKIRQIAGDVGAFLQGDFTLSSGKKSTYYFDGRKLAFSPEGAYWIGRAIFDELKGTGVEAIGGIATGAYPIVTAVALVSYLEGEPLPAFIVRDVVKEHGTKRQVEGHLREGSAVAIVDDVITTGGSVFKAIELAEAAGCKVVRVMAIVDRHEGGSDILRNKGYDFTAVLNIWPPEDGKR